VDEERTFDGERKYGIGLHIWLSTINLSADYFLDFSVDSNI